MDDFKDDQTDRLGPTDPSRTELTILLPVFNDWSALRCLLVQLDQVLAGESSTAHLLVVDDGSTLTMEPGSLNYPYQAIDQVEILHLRRNLGHQRAIAVGLAYLEAERPATELIVVMDSDGEDDPRDIPRLIERAEQTHRYVIIFAERTKRSESLLFRSCYHLYRVVHRVLTGLGVRVGNFSVIPRVRLQSLVVTSELWNHYAAAAITSRQPYQTISTARAKRLEGHSQMNFVGLVIHGLSAISVYSDRIGIRLMLATLGLIVVDLVALICTLAIRVTTNLAIPGWTTTVFGVLLILLMQATLFLFVFSFMILAGRNSASFLPRRDYVYFVGSKDEVYRR